jgi:hypothetical protein
MEKDSNHQIAYVTRGELSCGATVEKSKKIAAVTAACGGMLLLQGQNHEKLRRKQAPDLQLGDWRMLHVSGTGSQPAASGAPTRTTCCELDEREYIRNAKRPNTNAMRNCQCIGIVAHERLNHSSHCRRGPRTEM